MSWARVLWRWATCSPARRSSGAIAEEYQASRAYAFEDRQDYQVGANRYELDVATRDADRIVLIETKSKMLTRKSRSGDMFSFFGDYSDSFLGMSSQLVRHEIRLRQGLTPLTVADEKTDDFRPIKVAVSPRSYGPVSDKALLSRLVLSLVGARLALVTPNAIHQRMIEAFNKRVEAVVTDIAFIAPKMNGAADLLHYLMDVYWLDLGQLLYILDRSNTVWEAFRPLSRITFSSRDFWTDLAQVDRVGLTATAGNWRPIT
jgi:hypothetical protein